MGCWAEAVSAPEEEPVSLLRVDLPQNWPLLGALTGVLALLFFRVYTTCFCSSRATVTYVPRVWASDYGSSAAASTLLRVPMTSTAFCWAGSVPDSCGTIAACRSAPHSPAFRQLISSWGPSLQDDRGGRGSPQWKACHECQGMPHTAGFRSTACTQRARGPHSVAQASRLAAVFASRVTDLPA